MKRIKKSMIGIAAVLLLLAGCSASNEAASTDGTACPRETERLQPSACQEEPVDRVEEVDWSGYFDGMSGAAVVYDPSESCCRIYNRELAETRRSPCSTFKIISSLIGLENRTIIPENSLRVWSGEVFWNSDWNRDIAFAEAFRSSCVWYFREVTDEIGKTAIQAELYRLQYGNCDISDWEGKQNTNNNNPALTGFWIESSLKISPIEQTQVMERIFGDRSVYTAQTREQLMQVMQSEPQEAEDIAVYGKTGMGKAEGVVVDAWFTGFSDLKDRRVYFCVYLGESPGKDVSSTKAKEIAAKVLLDDAARPA